MIEANETVILLAEDDVLVRTLVQSMLSKEGYNVLAAKDGQEADEICERFAGPIHLLLTDVNMPRMTGPELAEKVRAHRPGSKIMIISGQTTTAILEENMHLAFLRKPFIPPTLLQCVQKERPVYAAMIGEARVAKVIDMARGAGVYHVALMTN